jgi:hypothetical protein
MLYVFSCFSKSFTLRHVSGTFQKLQLYLTIISKSPGNNNNNNNNRSCIGKIYFQPRSRDTLSAFAVWLSSPGKCHNIPRFTSLVFPFALFPLDYSLIIHTSYSHWDTNKILILIDFIRKCKEGKVVTKTTTHYVIFIETSCWEFSLISQAGGR